MHDLSFEGVACVNDEWGVLFDELPVITAMVGGDDDTIAGAQGLGQIGGTVQPFAIDADAGDVWVMEDDASAFFTQEMNDIERR